MGVDFVVSRKKRKVGVEEKVAAVLNYVTIFPPMSDHQFHHQGEAAGLIEPLDERVREYIKKLVRGGVRRKADILSGTKEYVNEEIFQGLLNPDRLRRRFKPDPHTIRNIIACVRYETRYSKFDQENVMELKKKWEADANVKFIPKGSAPKLEEILDKFDSEYLEWDDADDIEEIPLNVDTLSELMGVLIDSFVPNLYERYVSLNIKYTDGYKGYSSSLPRYMVNRPGPLIEDMLQKKNKITPFMVSSVQPVLVCTSPVFAVQSVSPTSDETNMYIIKFGDKDTIFSCECGSFKHDRLLCKHFFAVFESKLGDFGDISPLYTNHTNIDWDVVGGVRVFGPEPEQQNQVIVVNQPCYSTSYNETHGFDFTASLPGRKKHGAKVAKQKLLSDLKVITEKIHNIRDYDHIMSMQEKVTEILQQANESLKMENEGELCSRVDNNSADQYQIWMVLLTVMMIYFGWYC